MDAALLVLHDKIKKENDVKKVKEEVRTLKRKRQALIDQENKMRDDINQNLKKIGPQYSNLAERQNQVVQMLKRGELQAEMRVHLNMDI